MKSRKIPSLALALSLVALAALVAPAPADASALRVAPAKAACNAIDTMEAAVFAAVPFQLDAGSHPLTITYDLGDSELFREDLVAEVSEESLSLVVELLATAPDQRAQLVEIAGSHPVGVRVTLSFAGREPIVRSLSEILAGTSAELQGPAQPVALRPAGTETTGELSFVAAMSQSCIDQCQDEFDWCVYNRCDYQWDPCDFCYDDLEECGFQCICPTYDEWTETSLVFVRYTGVNYCTRDVYSTNYLDNASYLGSILKPKYTLKRKTTFCNHTTSTEVVSVTYGAEYTCYRYFDDNCYPRNTATPPSCIW